MISPSRMSIVLSRVYHEKLSLEPGKQINAYFMVEDKDKTTGKYTAISSEEVQIQWLAAAQITQIFETSLSQATSFAVVSLAMIGIILASNLF